ncbi:uncharacterized protein IL334_006849 [Kwoniella shivajii]|uniref:RING-type E3 ubiquitin transferase n=1 Tax=Kwoniella shivajii TaxID=564305 RepID=A0ABZ1D7H3_9TREE|nr:hypothetical protein IL334_006849 [Kwoniella shivajii]
MLSLSLTRLWVFLVPIVLVSSIVLPSPAHSPSNDHTGISLGDRPNGDLREFMEFDLDQVSLRLPRTGNEGQGWLTRWLSMGGEGEVVIHLPPSSTETNSNLSLPHRPAAFPSVSTFPLPLSGFLISFSNLPDTPKSSNTTSTSPNQACVPPIGLPRPPSLPSKAEGANLVLIERGGCDFATKIRAAQDRGAHAVVVGDSIAHKDENDEEGQRRETLITMFSPEDTESIFIPSVFVSRASYLVLRDLLANGTSSGKDGRDGLWVDLSQGSDESGALTSLLSFALLMPSLFLLATIAVHRIRVARQREKDRAPPMIVLSLPERIWTPDIVWEKDDSSCSSSGESIKSTSLDINEPIPITPSNVLNEDDRMAASSSSSSTPIPPPPPISPSEVKTPPAVSVEIEDPLSVPHNKTTKTIATAIAEGSNKRTHHHQHPHRVKRQYFSKDECAICMDNFASGDVVRILPCGHVFHKEECDEWLMKWRKLCPTCRADVTLPPGGNFKGSTITPVSNPPISGEDSAHDLQDRSWTSMFRSARERLHGFGLWRNGVRLDDNESDGSSDEGERTPLVARSPNSQRRSRSATP